jgi:RNA polymerase sigma-70 factor (ECF subfamily)
MTYRTYYRLLLFLSHRILGNREDAEDVVQEAFTRIYENYDCLADPTGPKTKRYVSVVTEHLALNARRNRLRHPTVPLEEIPKLSELPGPNEEALAVWEAFNHLSEPGRTALLLSCYCGLTAKETASTMHMTVSRAEKLIGRTKKAFQKLWEVGKE